MSAPSSVQCPEPMPYSNEIYGYSDIDFTAKNPPVYSAQPASVQVDSILSNQLGPITNPVLAPSTVTYSVPGFPVLPEVESSSAKPLLSSYSGAEIDASTTLANNNLGFVSVNDVVSPLNTPSVQLFTNVSKKEPAKSVPIEAFNNAPNKIKPEYKNLPKIGPAPKPATKSNNISHFIAKQNNKIEHFKPTNVKKVEHFSSMTIMDNLVLILVIGAIIYYVVSSKFSGGDSSVDFKKIPIVSQLSDDHVSMENKLIIIAAIVIAFILIQRMLK